MSTTTTEVVGGQKVRRTKRRVEPIYYLFLLPSLILFTLAITIPGIIGIFFSFTDSIGIGDWSNTGRVFDAAVLRYADGQEQLRAPGSPLRRLVEGDQPMSLLLWGPPGTGKTTIAAIVSQQTDRRFVEVSAVSAGVKEVRAAIDGARAELPRAALRVRRRGPLPQPGDLSRVLGAAAGGPG